jgi:hypothetical protein
VIVATSVAWESLFLHHGIAWLFDEGWPLYAAMQLHAGHTLYTDVLFPFPPGHLLMAWIAWAIDPPGILLARTFYAAFDVALCVALYFLGRRLTSPGFAFLGALLVAVAAPRSHLAHLLFGYRYLVLSVGVLLLLAARLRCGEEETARARRLLLAAGALTGVALYFRLTPAFAVSCGVGAAIVSRSRDWREAARDGAAYALGLALVVAPILAWFGARVGLDVLWREVVTRIVALQSAQSLPSPAFSWLPAHGDRAELYRWFVALQYRLYIVLYAGYAVALAGLWLRSRRAGRRFQHALLLAVVVWGGIYLLRALGRSDDHHLMSALPPACLLLAHALGAAGRRAGDAVGARGGARVAATTAVGLLVLSGWIYLQRVDVFLLPRTRGLVSLASTGGEIRVASRAQAQRVDGVVAAIRRLTTPQDVFLDLTGAPLLHPLTGRLGPGRLDVVTPGIFLDEGEQRAFVAQLEAARPALVLWPATAFDRRADRHVQQTAPLVAAWVLANYEEALAIDRYRILRPRSRPDGAGGGTR